MTTSRRHCIMSREMVAKWSLYPCHCTRDTVRASRTGSQVVQWGAGWPAGRRRRDETSKGAHGGWRETVAGVAIRPPLGPRQAVGNQPDKAGSRGWWRGGMVDWAGCQRRRDRHRARRVLGGDGKGSGGGAWDGVAVPGARPVTCENFCFILVYYLLVAGRGPRSPTRDLRTFLFYSRLLLKNGVAVTRSQEPDRWQ